VSNLVIRAKYIFPVSAPPIYDGAVLIKDRYIRAVDTWEHIRKSYLCDEIHDIGNGILMPAAVNTHTHLELTCLADAIPANTPFIDWILSLVKARNALSVPEMVASLEEGVHQIQAYATAAAGDIATGEAIVEQLAQTSLAGIVYYELLSLDPNKADTILEQAKQKRAYWQQRYSRADFQFGLSLHSPYTASAELLHKTANWCKKNHVPLSIHTAESLDESEFLLQGDGEIPNKLYRAAGWEQLPFPIPKCSPIDYLNQLGVLDAKPLLIHVVHTDEDDLGILKRKNIAVAHCPRSNLQLMNGRFRLAEFLKAGIKVSFGTDSLASCPSLSIWEEMQKAWEIHTHAGDNIAPELYLACATLNGAEALALAHKYGSIEPGKIALFGVASLDNFPKYSSGDMDKVLMNLMTGECQIGNLPFLN